MTSGGIQTDPSGERFRIDIFPDGGTLNRDVYRYDGVLPIVNPNEFYNFNDILPSTRNVWQKRSGMPYADSANLIAANDAANHLVICPTQDTNATAYGFSPNASTVSASTDGTAGTVVASAFTNSELQGKPAFINSQLVCVGASSDVFKCAGGAIAQYTGTATVTNGSTAVTNISATLSAGQQTGFVGQYFVVTSDASTVLNAYRITAIGSSSTLTLDRPYVGAQGAGAAIRIRCVDNMRCTAGIFSADTIPRAKIVSSAWNRLILAGTTEFGVFYPNRLRWSGAAGSTDGAALTAGVDNFTVAQVGINAFHANGYIDVSPDLGNIVAVVPYSNALIVFQIRGMTIIYGTPVFNGVGSLDATLKYNNTILNNPLSESARRSSYCLSPFGVFFYDTGAGLMLWDGSGVPRNITKGRLSREITGGHFNCSMLEYWDGYVVFMSVGDGDEGLIYHVETDSFATISARTTAIRDLQLGVDALNHNFEGPSGSTMVAFTGQRVVNVSHMWLPVLSAATGTDFDSVPINIVLTTAQFGDHTLLLRPERIVMTYKLSGASSTPYFTVAFGGFTSAATDFPEQTSKATVACECNTSTRSHQPYLSITEVGVAEDLVIYGITIEGTIEGIGPS